MIIRRLGFLLCLVPALAFGQQDLSGRWVVTTDIYGNPLAQKLTLKSDAGKLTGKFDGDDLEGTVNGNAIHFVAKDKDGNTSEYNGIISGDTFSGNADMNETGDHPEHTTGAFSARKIPDKAPRPPQRHEFVPSTFYREFSARTKPVLTIWPGDTVHTTTVDAGGTDEKGVTRVLGGNPETGPFYVETAMPGDTLVVHLNLVRLNRDWAVSDDAIVGRASGPQMAIKMKDGGKNLRWLLDRQRLIATPEKPGEHMKNYSVPIRPMLGCIGVAPGFASAPINSGDSGRFGGNMDFNEIVEGTTVYLPVSQPGALLYVGDGHALQGDGELNGNALETSMDVEFTVDVIHDKGIMTPRVESPTHMMAVGLGGSLEDAMRLATASMTQWLEQDYRLTPSEVAQVLGTSVEYTISEVADRNAGVAAKIRKERLGGLIPGK
jgi:acetamidase/formamidase